MYAAILLSHALINHFGIRLVAWLNDFSVTVHVVGVVVIVGALTLFAPKQPLGYFVERVTFNDQGWPYWFAFVIGLLQAQWTFTGYDASASVSEETVDPRRRVPWGIVMAVAVSAVVGYALLLALTLAIKDIPAVLNARDASGNKVPAVIAIFTSALGERAGSLFTGLAAMAMWFCGLSAVTWISRTIYAFARDNGLPGSALWRRVSATHRTPGPAIWLCVVIAFLTTISAGTYAVVTSISVIGLYFSYIIPVYLAWRARGRGNPVPRGPWHLGRLGPAINVLAMLWVVFISFVLSIPDHMRAGKTMGALTGTPRRVVSRERAPPLRRTGLGVPGWASHRRVGRSGQRSGVGRVTVHEAATGRGLLTLDGLRDAVTAGDIETVIVGFTDHYGRLMGKRYDAEMFVDETASHGTHGCDYLLTTDMEMEPVQGYDFANWEKGYGDFHLLPDLATLRVASWLEKSALVLCDVKDERTHDFVRVAPRSLLRDQVEAASGAGLLGLRGLRARVLRLRAGLPRGSPIRVPRPHAGRLVSRGLSHSPGHAGPSPSPRRCAAT